ncbi:MAG: outer membrane protein/peptidoglycan-associated protein [Bacteroidetes bacterium]|nr:outer membrane protein/peptidoglycan-associated protein [Bacteroidota bacterium]
MKSFKCLLVLIFIPMVMFSKDRGNVFSNDIEHYYSNNNELTNITFSNEIGPKKFKKPKRKKKKNKDIGNEVNVKRRPELSKRYSPKRKKPKKISNTISLAVKTNLVYAAVITPNIALELPVKKKFSIELSSTYNAWDMKGNVKWKNMVVMSEIRFWPKKTMQGMFYGLNVNWSKYNIGGIIMPYYGDAHYYRYDGWTAGVGISAGYMWYWSSHWSFEANIGIGVNYTSYDKYLQPVCGAYWGSFKNILIMPTKIGLSFVYKFN